MMTLAFPRTIAQVLKPHSAFTGHRPFKFPAGLFFKALKSSSSCQTSVTTSDDSEGEMHQKRVPLKEVVADCVGRWFKEHVKAAQAGDPETQIIVGQMICSGYGVQKDPLKGQDWIRNARCIKKALKAGRGPKDQVKMPDDYYFLN